MPASRGNNSSKRTRTVRARLLRAARAQRQLGDRSMAAASSRVAEPEPEAEPCRPEAAGPIPTAPNKSLTVLHRQWLGAVISIWGYSDAWRWALEEGSGRRANYEGGD